MAVASLVCAVVVLVVLRLVSNPVTVRNRRNRALARMLEFVLFRHDPVLGMGALGRVVMADLAYLGTMVAPMLVSVVPVVLMIAQVEARLANRPLKSGETIVVKACLPDRSPVMSSDVLAAGARNVRVETAPVRIPARNELAWRARAGENGAGWIEFRVGGQRVRKSIQVGGDGVAVSVRRERPGFWYSLMNPAEPALPADAPVLWIEAGYPALRLQVGSVNCHWLAAFIVLTMAMALVVRKPLGVEL